MVTTNPKPGTSPGLSITEKNIIMESIREFLTTHLTKSGMSEAQSKRVLQKALPHIHSLAPDHGFSFDSPIDGYPAMMKPLLVNITNEQALEWIDENLPQAWFRPMFVN